MSESWEKRIGVQTIIWGNSFRDKISDVVKAIRSLGFCGLEVFQHPALLPPAKEFEQLLGNDLLLLGLSGGQLHDRLTYAKSLQIKPLYIYSQSVEKKEMAALEEGFTIGLHPHQFSAVSTFAGALKLTQNQSRGKIEIIYDTAHSFLAGENILQILRDFGDKIRYIHLKDWNPYFGSSFFSYAKGFCAAGDGIALQDKQTRTELIKWLSHDKSRYIIIEQDWTDTSIERSLQKSLDWLTGSTQRLTSTAFRKPLSNKVRSAHFKSLSNPHTTEARNMLLDLKAHLLFSVQKPSLLIYHSALEQIASYARCLYATLWEVNSTSDLAVLRATYQPVGDAIVLPNVQQLSVKKALAGIAVENRLPFVCADISESKDDERSFQDVALAEKAQLKGMVVLPVFNSYNQNQPELILCLFPKDLSTSVELLELPKPDNMCQSSRASPLVDCVTSSLSVGIEASWHHSSSSLENAIDWHAAQSKNSADFLARVSPLLASTIQCRAVEIYWLNTNDTLTALFPQSKKPARFEKVNATWHWSVIDRTNKGLSEEGWTVENGRVLASPLYAQRIPISSVFGLIACVGKDSEDNELPTGLFSMTDTALLDSAQSAIALHLVRMMEDEGHVRQVRRIVHELREPLTIFRGASTAAIKEMKDHGWAFPKKDHLQVFRRYLGLMEQTAAMIGFTQSDFQVTLMRRRCLLFEEIIKPALDDLEVLLTNNKLNRSQIIVSKALEGEALYLDQFRMRQVVFNLLVNAVKYSKRDMNEEVDPSIFRVEIEGRISGGRSFLIIRDNGIGIPFGYEDIIFEEGVRAPNAVNSGVDGNGLGLHIVRRILAAHEATIRVSREIQFTSEAYKGTTMIIEFPAKLREPTFKQSLQADIRTVQPLVKNPNE